MDTQNFTNATQELINDAIRLAMQRNNPTLQPIHTLKAGLENDFCITFLDVLQTPISTLAPLVDQAIDQLPSAPGTQLSMDQAMHSFLTLCKKDADALGDQYISLEHIMLAWSETEYLPPINPFILQTTWLYARQYSQTYERITQREYRG